MLKERREIDDIASLIAIWESQIKLSNALDYFDINKASEGLCQQLLNLLYGYNLQDLNAITKNFPGLDLGDFNKTKLAFQITSRTDKKKIQATLDSFVKNDYLKKFPSGVKFLILNSSSKIRTNKKSFNEHREYFNPQKDILNLQSLINDIKTLYKVDEKRFYEIKKLLENEIGYRGSNETLDISLGLSPDNNTVDRLAVYKELYLKTHSDALEDFVPFEYVLKDKKISTEEALEAILINKRAVIIGKSGCGKSLLARHISLKFLNNGIPVFLEAKYYNGDFDSFVKESITQLGIETKSLLFAIAPNDKLELLLIIDGINECTKTRRLKLIREIEELEKRQEIRILFTTQVLESEYDHQDTAIITIDYPDLEVKKSIAKQYSKGLSVAKLEPILSVVSTSLEAKMIGQIGSEDVEKISRFSIFDFFVRKKLIANSKQGMLLLSRISEFLTERISFSMSMRQLNKLQDEYDIPITVLSDCINAKILVQNHMKISFSHELFLNFFIAENISLKLGTDSSAIIDTLSKPKYRSNNLMIIGSIEDLNILEEVLSNISNSELILQIISGEAGEFAQTWAYKRLRQVLSEMEEETKNIKFELSESEYHSVLVKYEVLNNWTAQDWAFIYSLPALILRDEFLDDVIRMINIMDIVIADSFKELLNDAKGKSIPLRSGLFSASYIPFFQNKRTSLSAIFSTYHSGAVSINYKNEISRQTISKYISGDIKNGLLYFFLIINRYSENLKLFYYIILKAIKKDWRYLAYHLKLEILEKAPACYNSEEQRATLVEAISAIDATIENVFISTSIIDALSALGALIEGSQEHEGLVATELQEIINGPDISDYWEMASGVYYAQFDHPYEEAYQNAISKLNASDKKIFIKKALQGGYSSFFTNVLVKDAVKVLGAECCPYILRWTENPFVDMHSKQSSLSIFFITHIVLAKFSYPLSSKVHNQKNEVDKALQACAEIYYWINHTNASNEQKHNNCKSLLKILSVETPKVSVDCIWQSEDAIRDYLYSPHFHDGEIATIRKVFPNFVADCCRDAIKNLDNLKTILEFDSMDKPLKHVIWLLEDVGNVSDLPLLRSLANHDIYGESALNAIKAIES